MKYSLLISDFDGTLAVDNKYVTSADYSAIASLRSAGAKFALCTGRMTRSAELICEKLPFKPLIAAFNGAEIKDAATGERLFYHGLAPKDCFDLARFAEQKGLNAQIYSDKVMTPRVSAFTEKYCDVCGCDPLEIGLISDFVEKHDYSSAKFMIIDAPERVDAVREEAAERFGDRFDIASSGVFLLDFTPKGINKGVAVEKLCEASGVAKEKCVAVGDERNDIPMILTAGLGVAVANARDELKAVAGYVTASRNGGAVAEIVNGFFGS